jgi:hypothetical protein
LVSAKTDIATSTAQTVMSLFMVKSFGESEWCWGRLVFQERSTWLDRNHSRLRQRASTCAQRFRLDG